MNPNTQRIIAFLEGVGRDVVAEARRKCTNPHLLVGALTEKGGNSAALGFSLALAAEVGRHGSQFSQSTLSSVDWERVGAHFSQAHQL